MTGKGGTLRGELGLIGLFDLGQLLLLNGANGCLSVTDGDSRGYLYFAHGRIVNAVDDTLAEGEAAAYRLFGWSQGTFEFRPENVPGDPLIQVSGDALMLEAARRLDEAGLSTGPAGGAIERLREHHGAFTALREAFRQLADEAGRRSPVFDGGLSALRLDALGRATDRLILRPGHRSWHCSHGAWQTLADGALAPADYDAIRAELMALSQPSERAADDGWPRRLPLATGVTLGIERAATPEGELLQVRPIEMAAPDPGILDGDRATLDSVLALNDALIFAVSDDAAVARRLLHALIASRIASGPEPVLVIGDDSTYRHAAGATPVVPARGGEIARMLGAFERVTVAIDPALGADPPRAASLQNAGLILAGATGPDPARAVSRWLLAVAGTEPGARASLAGRDLLVVWGDGEPDDERALAFRLWSPPPRDRAQLMSGETVAFDPGSGPPRLKVVRPQS
jgi:hypothetical protein